MSIPAIVNTMGAVTIVCSSRRDSRLKRNRSETKDGQRNHDHYRSSTTSSFPFFAAFLRNS